MEKLHEALLQSGSMADVALKVGSEEIQAHSIILGARSPVFERMFSCPMKEKKDKEVHIQADRLWNLLCFSLLAPDVLLQDLEAAPVKALVKYLYTGVVDQTSLDNDNLALSLLEAAHRYEVPGLVERCVQVIVTRFKVETVAERLEMADMIGSKYFKAQCLEYIQAHLVDVQATDDFIYFLLKILQCLATSSCLGMGPSNSFGGSAASVLGPLSSTRRNRMPLHADTSSWAGSS
eukprot:g11930.t1